MRGQFRTLRRTISALAIGAVLLAGLSGEALAQRHRARHARTGRHWLTRHDQGRHLGWTKGQHRGWSHSRHRGVTGDFTGSDVGVGRRDGRRDTITDVMRQHGDGRDMGGHGLGRGLGRGHGKH